MRGENVRRSRDLQRGIEIQLLLDDVASDALEREKGRVAFVHVEDFGVDAERAERFDATDAKHDLLAHSHLEIAAIKLRGNETILRAVFRRIGIEQIKIDSANAEFPNLSEDIAVQNPNGNAKIRALTLHLANRQVMKILVQVDRVLQAFLVNLLPEVAVPVEQADRDKV